MINSKLKSTRGATLVFAMVALVIATIVCAVIIYAAQANAGRIRSAQASEQAYLTLNSAASVVRKQIADTELFLESKSYSYAVKATKESAEISYSLTSDEVTSLGIPTGSKVLTVKTEYPAARTMVYKNPASLSTPDSYESTSTDALGAMQEQIVSWSVQIMDSPSGVGTTFTGTKTFVLKAPNMDDVYVELSIIPGAIGTETSEEDKADKNAQKYYITAVLSFGPDSGRKEMLTMSFMANYSDSADSSLSNRKSFTKTDSVDNKSITVDVKIYENVETHKVSWQSKNVVVNTANLSTSG